MKQVDKLAECDQMLRTGPGGDLSSLLKKKKRPILLNFLLGKHLPLHTGISTPNTKPVNIMHWVKWRVELATILCLGRLPILSGQRLQKLSANCQDPRQ